MSGDGWLAAGSLLVAALSVASSWANGSRSERSADRRHASERFRAERLAAYSEFIGYARSAYRDGWWALGSRKGAAVPEEELGAETAERTVPGVYRRLSELASPIRILSPDMAGPADDVVVGLTMFLVDVDNGDRKLAYEEDPAEELSRFESAAARDLQYPITMRRRWRPRRA